MSQPQSAAAVRAVPQVLWEHGGPDLIIDRAGGPTPLSVLLPDGFGREDLPEHR